MAVSIDWGQKIIFVPKTYMSLIQLTPFEVRQLDVNQFRLDLKALEASVDGMPFDNTHNHNTEIVLSGVAYARIIEIINDYTIEFEDGTYGVTLYGANNNLLDVKVPNQVSLLANNSAGLINSESINDQSYLGAKVYIDTTGRGVSGTTYPDGTPTSPSDNFNDAEVIADNRNLNGFHLDGILTFPSLNDLSDTDWIGQSPIKAALAIGATQDITNATFYRLGITGAIFGRASYEQCALGGPLNLTGFNGIATDCGVNADITIEASATENIMFRECTSIIAGTSKPTLNYNGATADLHVRGWIGGLKLTNFTAGNDASIDVHSGSIEIDSTCTSGTIVIRGVTELIDNSGVGCTIVKSGLVDELVWNKEICP